MPRLTILTLILTLATSCAHAGSGRSESPEPVKLATPASATLWLQGVGGPRVAWTLVELLPNGRLTTSLQVDSATYAISPAEGAWLDGRWHPAEGAEGSVGECVPAQFTLELASGDELTLTLDGRCDLGVGPNFGLGGTEAAAGGVYLACPDRAACVDRMEQSRKARRWTWR